MNFNWLDKDTTASSGKKKTKSIRYTEQNFDCIILHTSTFLITKAIRNEKKN